MPPKTDGSGKTFAIILTAFSAVIAPIIVHFATQASAQPPLPSAPTVSLAASLPEMTVTPGIEGLPTTISPTMLPTTLAPTQIVVIAPGSVVEGGTPVMIDQLSLRVLPEDLRVEGGMIRLSIRIQNTGTERRLLSFPISSIRVTDDQGNDYPLVSGKAGCKSSAEREIKNIQIEPGKEVVLASGKDAAVWCQPDQPLALPIFIGPVQPEARQLRVEFDGFGPFDNFSVAIKL